MFAQVEQEAATLRQKAEKGRSSAECGGCAIVLSHLERLEALRSAMLEDGNKWARRYTEALETGDSSVLLGRYLLEELILPLKDFLQGCSRAWPEAQLPSAPVPAWQPGRYSRVAIKAMRMELDVLAAFQAQALLHFLDDELAASLPQPVLIAPAALNVLYTGVANPLRVYGGAADPATLKLEGPGVRFDDTLQQWVAKPMTPGPVVVRLTGLAPGGNAVQGSATFEARRVPEPLIYIGGRSDGVLVQRDINGQTGIAARNDDFLFAAGYTIRGFELVYTPEYGSPVLAKTPGNKFTDEMMAVLKRTKPGDRLLFRVAVEYPDGSIKTLSPTFYLR